MLRYSTPPGYTGDGSDLAAVVTPIEPLLAHMVQTVAKPFGTGF